ncbi:MAG: DUF3243 family protein [Thermaerobacter sp.]|jgi:hypothetical protein|nr:DUF3243 family protein [Thermaerobacter sp.]
MPNPVNPGNQANLPSDREVKGMPSTAPDSFQDFRQRVAQRIRQGKPGDLQGEVVHLGNLMSERGVSPQNREERLMKEIWEVSTPQEKETLAGLMVRLTERELF